MHTVSVDRASSFRRAVEHHRAGRWQQAEPLYRELLEFDPSQPDILHLLGVLSNQTGKPDLAADLIRQAVALNPNSAEYHNSLGNVLRAQGDLRAAAASFEQALTINPQSAEVFTNLGSLMEQSGNLEDAALCFLRALEIDPGYADAHYTFANLLKRVGNLPEAEQHYLQAIDPGCDYAPEALNNLGTTLRRLGRPEEAIERFRQAMSLRAPYFEANINLADALEEMGRLEEAARLYHEILAFQPDSAIAYSGAAGILQDQGRPERAVAAYRQALALAPDNAILHSNLLLSLHYAPAPSGAELLAAHQDWNIRHARALGLNTRQHDNVRDPDRKLRIGFVSADFRRHPVGFFLAPVLASPARRSMEFLCYSDVLVPDEMTERLAAGADEWRPSWTLDDAGLAELVRLDQVDILVDLAGHTRGNRLLAFARRPAPVQVTWAGYPDTTGLDQMDYLLTDGWQTPAGSEQYFVEQVLRLPHGYVCYEPPAYAPPVTDLPAASSGSITFGCFNRLAKVNAEVLRLWAQLMRALPDSRLVLRTRALADETVAKRYRKMFSNEGVAPARVDLLGAAPHAELLGKYGEIDIALDPFPCSGGLSTCEALWMGVPVVTLAGERLASRHAASHLHNVSLGELSAGTPEQYLAIAQDLALDTGRLSHLRAGLRERVRISPLCDGAGFTEHLGAALRDIWRHWCGR